ncbi:MAG: hypothetical protein CSA34_02495 [Desulfobulbus propionicus]|nr:MAG: hypothetical protein CSA34_02495 [Desulfobulbus propionicus]
MMAKTYFLIKVKGQLFAIDRDVVAGVVLQGKARVIEENGVTILPISGGRRAVIVDLGKTLNSKAPARPSFVCYCVLRLADIYLALPMQGKGRQVMAMQDALLPLPAACTAATRALISEVLVNGKDTVPIIREQVLRESVA